MLKVIISIFVPKIIKVLMLVCFLVFIKKGVIVVLRIGKDTPSILYRARYHDVFTFSKLAMTFWVSNQKVPERLELYTQYTYTLQYEFIDLAKRAITSGVHNCDGLRILLPSTFNLLGWKKYSPIFGDFRLVSWLSVPIGFGW